MDEASRKVQQMCEKFMWESWTEKDAREAIHFIDENIDRNAQEKYEDCKTDISSHFILKLARDWFMGLLNLRQKNFRLFFTYMGKCHNSCKQLSSIHSFCCLIYITACQCTAFLLQPYQHEHFRQLRYIRPGVHDGKQIDGLVALHFLAEAENTFTISMDFLRSSIHSGQIRFDDLPVSESKEFVTKLQKLHICTLELLGDFHSAMGDTERVNKQKLAAQSMKIRMNILNMTFLHDALSFAVNFISRLEFKAARHHLACFTYGMTELSDSKPNMNMWFLENILSMDMLEMKNLGSMIKCFYVRRLMWMSSKEKGIPGFSNNRNKLTEVNYKVIGDAKVQSFENEVTGSVVETFDGARELFKYGMCHYNEARKICEELCLDVLKSRAEHDIAYLYYALAVFENDEKRKCQMLKRAIDIWENDPEKLTSLHPLSVKRQVRCYMGQSYKIMALSKIQQLESSGYNPEEGKMRKIRSLLLKGISNYEIHIANIRDSKDAGDLAQDLLLDDITFDVTFLTDQKFGIAFLCYCLKNYCNYKDFQYTCLGIKFLDDVLDAVEKFPLVKVCYPLDFQNACERLMASFSSDKRDKPKKFFRNILYYSSFFKHAY